MGEKFSPVSLKNIEIHKPNKPFGLEQGLGQGDSTQVIGKTAEDILAMPKVDITPINTEVNSVLAVHGEVFDANTPDWSRSADPMTQIPDDSLPGYHKQDILATLSTKYTKQLSEPGDDPSSMDPEK